MTVTARIGSRAVTNPPGPASFRIPALPTDRRAALGSGGVMESRLALKVLVLLALPAVPLGLREVVSVDPGREHHRVEVARLRAHFDSVDAELQAPTALPLTPAQRTSRATLIGWLRDYREAGSFP